MTVNRCVEQGIYVVLILSLQKDHRPLRSSELSDMLSVSDSYLKKVLRRLVLAGILISSRGKEGGFHLARPIEEITAYDVYAALEGGECELKLSGLGYRIFDDDEKFDQGEERVVAAFERATEAFCDELRKLPLSDLVSKEHYQEGTIDFVSQRATKGKPFARVGMRRRETYTESA